jgi:hypothetical protein
MACTGPGAMVVVSRRPLSRSQTQWTPERFVRRPARPPPRYRPAAWINNPDSEEAEPPAVSSDLTGSRPLGKTST